MNMTIQHNLAAMNASGQYKITTGKRSKSTEKLSSGYRINRAADDAAGLAISEKMRRQIKGLNQASRNIQDGVSLCQVADGALSEVHEMLHRLEELSVQSANGTNSYEDRQYIQEETNKILQEIDRIGDETTFNEIPVFKGRDIPVYEDDGTPVIEGEIPFDKLSLADVELGLQPFSADSPAGYLNLSAVVKDDASNANGITIPLIYGNGSTSYSSVRLTNKQTGEEKILNINNFSVSDYSETPGRSWSRSLIYQDSNGLDLSIKQRISYVDGEDQKFYRLSYLVAGNENDIPLSENYDVDFMFNVDTSYGGDGIGDGKEAYYVDGNRLTDNIVYKNSDSIMGDSDEYADKENVNLIANETSRIFSIYGTANGSESNQLSFTQFVNAVSDADVISIGQWTAVDKWNNYSAENVGNLIGKTMVTDTRSEDLAFSLMWRLTPSESTPSRFLQKYINFGIRPAASDPNIDPDDINYSSNILTKHESDNPIYIQAGVEAGQGIYVHTREMNSRVLGLHGIDVSTADGAQDSIPRIKNALHEVSDHRSTMGAQQNRLEHAIKINDNTAENTQYAESQIRDTDMAMEMVQYSNLGILEQAGTSMLSQANQSRQNILSLLQ